MGKQVVQGIGIGLVAIVIVVSIGSYIGSSLSHHGEHGGEKHKKGASDQHETQKKGSQGTESSGSH